MPLHFYTDLRVLRAVGLFPIVDANLRALEALRVSYIVPDHAPPSLPAAPVVATDQPSLRPSTPATDPVMVGSSSEEDEAMSPLLRRPRLLVGEASVPNPQDVVLESQGRGTCAPPSPEGHLSSSSPLLGQSHSPLPMATQVQGAALGDANGQQPSLFWNWRIKAVFVWQFPQLLLRCPFKLRSLSLGAKSCLRRRVLFLPGRGYGPLFPALDRRSL
ncbi:hypothetical protein LIER_23327 [Lithospermum erythrorhizon]|uniref:Uncharacterized protein n=1 Tax=Lithospermum erythrorhizon TaxID=34254 RepID=A0AAV3QX93_LITER